MFKVLVNFIFWLITKLSSLIFTPIVAALTALFPDLGSIISGVKYFLSEYVFDTLKWFKMFCINTLAFPGTLLDFITSFFMIMISIYTAMLLYKGVITLYNKLKP